MSDAVSVVSADPASYQPHALHRGDVSWLETNCYTDVWIELLHALGHEPLAGLGFTLRTDLEADQFSFFKFSHADIEDLYGIEVIELNPWTTVFDQVMHELRAGRVPLVEMDSWFLPDTAATAYQHHHVKSTIAIARIDVDSKSMRYFHNSGFYELGGEDFDGLFRDHDDSERLVPYIEVAKLDRSFVRASDDLAALAVGALARTVRRMPENPFDRYRPRFALDVEAMRSLGPEAGAARFHAYAFAYFRQFGPAFALAAAHLRWLAPLLTGDSSVRSSDLLAAAESYDAIGSAAKTLQLRTARAAMAGRAVDANETFDSLCGNWQRAYDLLRPLANA